MFVRLITVNLQLDKIDEAARIYQNDIIPVAQAQKGIRSVDFWVNRATGKGCSVAVWETEEDMKAGETSSYLREQIARVSKTFASQPVIEGFEVAAHGETERA